MSYEGGGGGREMSELCQGWEDCGKMGLESACLVVVHGEATKKGEWAYFAFSRGHAVNLFLDRL
jgi:hypothetical protein